MKNKIFSTFCIFAMVSGLFLSCTDENNQYISIYETVYTDLNQGTSIIFEPAIDNAEVEWKSLDPNIATVFNGVATAVSEGKVTIVASNESKKYKQSYIVTVNEIEKEFTTDASAYSVTVGKKQIVKVLLNGKLVTKDLTFKSSNEEIFTVDNGLITGIAQGSAYLTVRKGELKAQAAIIVSEEEPIVIENLFLSNNNVDLLITDKYLLTASTFPQNAQNKGSIEWKSSDEEVCTVENGMITGISLGEAIITCNCGDITAKALIKVVNTDFCKFVYESTEIGEDEVYSLDYKKGAWETVESVKPTINKGAIVKSYSLDNDQFAIDEYGVITPKDKVNCGEYELTVKATGTTINRDVTLSTTLKVNVLPDITLSFSMMGYKIIEQLPEEEWVSEDARYAWASNYEIDTETMETRFGMHAPGDDVMLNNSGDKYFSIEDGYFQAKHTMCELDSYKKLFYFIDIVDAHEKGDPNNKVEHLSTSLWIICKGPRLYSFKYEMISPDFVVYSTNDDFYSYKDGESQVTLNRNAKVKFSIAQIKDASGTEITDPYFLINKNDGRLKISGNTVPAGTYDLTITAEDKSYQKLNPPTVIEQNVTVNVKYENKVVDEFDMTGVPGTPVKVTCDYDKPFLKTTLGEAPEGYRYQLINWDDPNGSLDPLAYTYFKINSKGELFVNNETAKAGIYAIHICLYDIRSNQPVLVHKLKQNIIQLWASDFEK